MTLLREAIGSEVFDPMQADPVLFVKAFDKTPWDFQADYMAKVVERREDGKFKHRIAVVSMPRQNGKSTLSCWLGLWRLYCDPVHQEIVSVALDRDSARIILNDARRIIKNSNLLFDQIDDVWGLTKSSIRLKDGRSWQIKSSEGVFSRGLRPTTICYDELGWSSDDGALYQILTAGQGAIVNPLIIVTSTVSPIEHGPLWDLFQAHEQGDPDVLLIYTNDNLSPLISEEYLEGQMRKLPAHVYLREHENRWGEGSENYCTQDDWKAAVADGDPRRDRDSGPCYLFADLSWAHDETAIAVSRDDGGKIDVVAMETFKPRKGQNIDFEAVEETILELVEKLNVKDVLIESPQGVMMTQRLQVKGVRADWVHPTAKSNREHWGAFYTALKGQRVRLPKDATLRQQLLTLTIKESASGWKVVDQPSIHQDRARAIAGSVYMAGKKAPNVKVVVVDMSMGGPGNRIGRNERQMPNQIAIRCPECGKAHIADFGNKFGPALKTHPCVCGHEIDKIAVAEKIGYTVV